MADNIKYEPGWSLDLTCTKPNEPNSGDPVRIGNLTGIALTDEDAAGKTAVNTGPFVAKFAVKANGGAGIAIGAPIWYHDDATPVLDNVSAGGYYYGIALEAISAGQTATIRVYHDCAPGGAGTLGTGSISAANLAEGAATADKLSIVANSRPIIVPLGDVSGNTSIVAFVAPTNGALNAAKIVTKDAVAAHDTDYWTFALTNKGAAGAGTDKIVEMTTEATGGTGLEAYTALSLGTLSTTHKDLAAGDVVLFTATKAAGAADLTEATLMLEFLPAEVS